LIFLITFNFSSQIIEAFTKNNSTLIPLGSKGIKYGFLALPITGLQIVGMMYFQAIGKFSKAAIIIVSKLVIIQIPAIVLLSNYFGINGAIAAFPVTEILTTVVVICFLSNEWKSLRKEKTTALSTHTIVSLDNV
jgi:Na+-driven multidrug efflux pump